MITVSREASERLAILEQLAGKWSPAINLVAAEDIGHLRPRHINDSLQLVAFLSEGRLVDLGSGGGFPGLVIAAATSLDVTLIEADARKAAFLRTASREMGLHNVTICVARIDTLPPQQADFVTARALAPLPKLLHYAHRHLHDGGTALLMKGARWRTEVDAALQMWEFNLDATPSSTDPSAAILHVTDLRPR